MKLDITRTQPSSASSHQQLALDQVEKRSHSRIAVSINVEAVELATGINVIGTASDLGFGGCFVETKHPFPEGTRIGIHFSCGGNFFRCRALITHADSGRGMGLVFTEADPMESVSVLEWVASVGDAGPAKAHTIIST